MAGDPKDGCDAGIVQSLDGCLHSVTCPQGVRAEEMSADLVRAAVHFADLAAHQHDTASPLASALGPDIDIDIGERALEELARGARALLFLAAGPYAIAGQMMAQLAGWNIPGAADMRQKQRPRTRFYDSIDPHTLTGALSADMLEGARFIIADPTGRDPVVLAQAEAVLAALDAAGLGRRLVYHVAGLAPYLSSEPGPLWQLLAARGARMLPHPEPALAAASALTPAGLMPALARGLDARALRAGARQAWRRIEDPTAGDGALLRSAAAMAAFVGGRRVDRIVIVPCADRLGRLADWMVALWRNVPGAAVPVHVGSASGPSAWGGPGSGRPSLVVALSLAPGAAAATPVGRIAAAALATEIAAMTGAARAAGHLVRTIHIPRLDEATIGGLLMQLLLEAILCGRLLEGARR